MAARLCVSQIVDIDGHTHRGEVVFSGTDRLTIKEPGLPTTSLPLERLQSLTRIMN